MNTCKTKTPQSGNSEAFNFYNLLTGGQPAHFRTFMDPKDLREGQYAHKYSGTLEQVLPNLESDNAAMRGVYMVVNQGGDDDASIMMARACFIDIDDGDLPTEWHLPPSMICSRFDGKGHHVYWLLHAGVVDMDAWSTMQKRLIAQYKSDNKIHNPSRILRLPQFLHWKDMSNPQSYYIVSANGSIRYQLEDIATGLPIISPTLSTGPATRGEVTIESDDALSINTAVGYLANAHPAVEGSSGDQTTFATAARVREYGLSEAKCVELMMEHWNPRCEPPWDISELKIKVANAYRYAKNAQGILHPGSMFGVSDGITSKELIRMGHHMTGDHAVDAEIIINHVFHGSLANFNGEIYRWVDKYWERFPDEKLVPIVTESMMVSEGQPAAIKVTNTRVNGTTSLLKNLVPVKQPLNPPSLKVFFNDGVYDAERGGFALHSDTNRNSFVLNADYEGDDKCDNWLAWLNDIFATDTGRIALLQEMMGWTLISDDLGIQKAPIFIGAPRGGKGTIINLLTRILGDAACSFHVARLHDDKIISGMLNAQVAFDAEAGSPSRQDASEVAVRLKAITSNDRLSIRRLYKQEPLNTAVHCKLFMAANTIPYMFDDSSAVAGRLLPLVFDKSALGKEDTELFERLNAELNGIALWSLEGLIRLVKTRKFTLPETTLNEMDSIKESGSPLLVFLADCCCFGRDLRCTDANLWKSYTEWCHFNSIEPLKRQVFKRAFIDATRSHSVQWKSSIRFEDDQIRRGFSGVSVRPINIVPFGGNV